MSLTKYTVLFLFAFILAGCNSLPSLDDVLPDTKNEYRKSRDLPVLEVPPDLTNTTNEAMSIPGENEAITLNEYQRQRAQATGSTVAGASSSRRHPPVQLVMCLQVGLQLLVHQQKRDARNTK